MFLSIFALHYTKCTVFAERKKESCTKSTNIILQSAAWLRSIRTCPTLVDELNERLFGFQKRREDDQEQWHHHKDWSCTGPTQVLFLPQDIGAQMLH